MNALFKRFFGILLLIAALIGLVFSALGMYITWRFRPRVIDLLSTGVDTAFALLDTTSQALLVTRQSLNTSVKSIQAIHSMLTNTQGTLETTRPMLDTVQTLMADELPATLRAVQVSLSTAQQAAKIIDTVLRTLTILTPDAYQPPKTLDEALGDIAKSMQTLPETLETIGENLKEAQGQFDLVQADLAIISESISNIQTNLDEFDAVVKGYTRVVNKTSARLVQLERKLPQIVTLADIVLTVFFVWMSIVQIGLYSQGMDLLKGAKRPPAEEMPPKERKAAAGP